MYRDLYDAAGIESTRLQLMKDFGLPLLVSFAFAFLYFPIKSDIDVSYRTSTRLLRPILDHLPSFPTASWTFTSPYTTFPRL